MIVSTGYYDLSNPLNIPGEELPKVFHYYREPHPFFDMDVVVIGGKNSAAIAALDLWRHGARVTLVHRGPKLHNHVKYWILPDIENRIKNRRNRRLLQQHGRGNWTRLRQCLTRPKAPVRLKNDFVFAMTGYHPDYDFLRSMGIELSAEQCRPVCDPQTLESNVPGNLRGGSDRGGIADQRNLHRKRKIPRQADRRPLEAETVRDSSARPRPG